MLTINPQVNLQELYEIDDYQWLLTTIDLLKHNRLHELDIYNLIEELEDWGSEKRNAVESLLEQVIIHLLLLQFWPEEKEFNAHHWRTEIIAFRNQLERKLKTKTLRNYLNNELDNIYKSALRYVKQKTNHTVKFPNNCPYTLAELLDFDWLPKN